MLPSESYIVRIYRRSKKNPRLIAGIVEQVGEDGWKAGFENAEEMQELLRGNKQANKPAKPRNDQ
ncbi:MAG: hypothetical protein OEW15_03945 [Nitrospirota bacterium]|nr:hypothetical protein [Nitrospirota bacterium]